MKSQLLAKLPVAFAAVHAVAVLAMATYIFVSLPKSGEYMMYWSIFYLVDFPLSLIVLFLAVVFGNMLPSDSFFNGMLALFFCVFGGYQYFWIGSKIRVREGTEKGVRTICERDK
ncbi:MAG: hypothetical protein WD468_00805 [Pirellulales bacterium]